MNSSRPRSTGRRSRRARVAFRSARPGDAAALTALALRAKGHWGYSDDFLEACRKELTLTPEMIGNPGLHVTVAESRGAIAGYSAVTVIGPDRCELEALFVDPHRMGAGIGRRLLHQAMALAKTRGAVVMKVQSDPGAAPFYAHAGGRATGHEASRSIPGRLLPVFEFVLQDSA